MPPEQIGVVCPSLERLRAPLDTAFGSLGIPYGARGPRPARRRRRSARRSSALLRFAWLGGGRRELFAFLRSPYSGLPRTRVDFVEGRLRGRAIRTPERVARGDREPERGARCRARRPCGRPRRRSRRCARSRPRCCAPRTASTATGRRRGVAARPARLRRGGAARSTSSRTGSGSAATLERDDVVSALERATVRLAAPAEPGRVAVLDLMRARTRRFDAVFVLGLEEGSLPAARAGLAVPRRGAAPRARARRGCSAPTRSPATATSSTRPARGRSSGSTSCARRPPTRAARASRARSGRRCARVFPADDVARWTRRRPLSALTWPRRDRADRARAAPRGRGALAGRARRPPRRSPPATAGSGGSTRARRAFDAADPARQPGRARAGSARARPSASPSSSASPTARRPGSSSASSTRRRSTPRSTRCSAGQVAHQVLFRFYAGLPKELGCEQVSEAVLDDALALPAQRASTTRSRRRAARADRAAAARARGLALARPRAVRPRRGAARSCRSCRGASRSRSAPSARRRSSSAGSTSAAGSRSPGRSTGSTSTRTQRRGIVQDYKSGKSVHSAAQIESELRLQIPLYMLVLRDLVGIEPLGGLYRALAGERKARGLLRAEARRRSAGLHRERLPRRRGVLGADRARRASTRAASASGSARATSRHDPKGGECPSWCDLWPMCRVQARMSVRSAARALNPEQLAAIEARRPRVRLGRRRHRARRPCSSSASCARSASAGLDVESILVITYTRARRRRAALADPRRARRARPPRPRARARRRLDLDDPRLLPAAAEGAPVRGRARPALPRARREPGARAPRRGVRGGARGVLRERRARAAAAARDLRRAAGCAGC